MKKLTVIFFISLFAYCKSDQKKVEERADAAIEAYKASQAADSSLEQMRIKNILDTTGLYLSPVQVLGFSITESDSRQYRNVTAEYKNVSTKKVSAIRFKWYGINAFGEPAEMGYKGMGTGDSDTPLNPGKSEKSTWETLSSDLKTIKTFYPYEVVYEDGTKWQLKK